MTVPSSSYSAEERLAVYGSLRPGGENGHLLADLEGEWLSGSVKGRLHEAGWAAASGYPAITLDDSADPIAVWLFCSHDLPGYWPTLDAFEGADYCRTPVEVRTDCGALRAFIYALSATQEER